MCWYEYKHRYNKEDLEKLHTKQLLNMRSFGIGRTSDCKYCKKYNQCTAIYRYNEDLLHSILATREHILNKQENKALRKEKKKQGN